jgi:hypothetical protein
MAVVAATLLASSAPANRHLCGVNQEWVNPLGAMLHPHYDGGHAAGWLPPNVSSWVNMTNPLLSEQLVSLLRALQLGSHRYPGGSIGNEWYFRNETFGPGASPYHWTIAQAMAAAFPPHAFGVAQFAELVGTVGNSALILWTLDVSAPGTAADVGVPALIAQRLGQPGNGSGLLFEIGNEVYDPRQGPPPSGFSTADEYLDATSGLVRAVHALPGARVGFTAGPCPFFYPEGSDCWGGVHGRYHQWNANLSRACTKRAADAGLRCDAVVVHDYVTEPKLLSPLDDAHLLSAFLMVPQVSIDNGVATLDRSYPPGTRIWLSEYNTMYASVWRGKSDAPSADCPKCRPSLARFFNLTANSAAHAVHVAGSIIAAMCHGQKIESMNYHSFLEGAGKVEFGPGAHGDAQPGFAVAALNASGAYISPVAQIISMISAWLSDRGSTMESVPIPHTAARLPFNLSTLGLGDGPAPCVHAAAICAAGSGSRNSSSRVLAVNRCSRAYSVAIGGACGGRSAGWASVLSFNASLAEPGQSWARVGGETSHGGGGPMHPSQRPAGAGDSVLVDAYSLAVVELDL